MIYLIDSDDSTAMGLKRLLIAEGFDVVVVADAMNFVDNDAVGVNDLIVLDSDTAGMDPKALISSLQAKGLRTPPVIVISCSHEPTAGHSPVDLARGAGAVGFFSKPVDGHALVDAIRFACS